MKIQKSIVIPIWVVLFLAAGISGCEKLTFNTKPTLKFERAVNYDISQGDVLGFNLRVTDKEGDISDTLFIYASTKKCPNSFLRLPYKIPDIIAKTNLNAELNVRFNVNITNGEFPNWNANLCAGVDTVHFKFWMKDLDKNVSDTVETDMPVLIRNS